MIIAWGLLVFIPFKTYCQQSIVKDPDFTLYDDSPAAAPIDFKNLYYWFNPNALTPDFFCDCSMGGTSPHFNGTTLGLYLTQQSKWEDARDYAGTRLKKSLDTSKIYFVKALFSISPRSLYALNRIGILFTNDSIKQQDTTNWLINRKPQIEADSNVFYVNDIELSRYWYELKKVFKPSENNLEYLYVGNFYPDDKTDTITKPKSPNVSYFYVHGGYYDFDYVDVIEVNPNYNLVANDTIICEGQNVTLSYATSYPGHTYSWYTSTGFVSNNLNTIVQPQQTTKYYLYTTDNYHAECDCNPPVLDSVTVTLVNYDVAGVNATNFERNLCSGDTIQLGIVPQNGYNYKWQPSDYLSSDTVAQPYVLVPWYLENDTLIYNVTITNNQNQSCTLNNDLAFKIVVNFCPDSLEPQIYIPNVFTPNGDGENDVFKLSTQNIKNLNAEVYNRWGIRVNSFGGINGTWQGNTIAGDKAPNGIYYVVITAEGMDKKTYHYSGYVHVY
jgi:gliding motility-associated-like protein